MRLDLKRLGAAMTALALAVGLTLSLSSPAQAESNGGVRIMPLGDSITDGYNVAGGYRTGLWQRAAAAGRTWDYVGSGFNGPASLGDHDHEGHSGWRIDEIDTNITGWLRTSNPRTILLHIGTNDIAQNRDVPNAPARLATLIDHIRVLAPNVELFVAQIIPFGDAALEAKARTFNAALPGIVAQRPQTHLVDMHSALTTADLADGVHPNAGGYDKMAARWYTALQSVPRSLEPITTPPTGSVALLSNPQSTRCLDIAGAAGTDGAQATIYDCHGQANQQWTRTAAGELRIFGGGRCLDINARGTANGTKVQSWTCNGTPAQTFTFTTNGTIVATSSGKCLDVNGGGTANGTLVQLWECNGTGAQRWTAR